MFLNKVGVQVEVAADGVECIQKVLSKDHEHYSLVLVGRLFRDFLEPSHLTGETV